MKKLIIFVLASAVFGTFSLPVVWASTNSNSSNAAAFQTCSVNLTWSPYSGQRRIYYGKWDGTYTIFLYRSGEDRDHYLARRVTSDTQIQIGNLSVGPRYVAEVFITGAFLHPDVPYWTKLSSFSCTPVTVQNTKVVKTQFVSTSDSNYDIMSKYQSKALTDDVMDEYDVENQPQTADQTVKVLPNTGWPAWIVALVPIGVALVGFWLFIISKKKVDKKYLPVIK